MIDLHSHLLPGVDDGSPSVEQSVKVLAILAAQGVTDICLTPHLEASRAARGIPPAQETAWEALRKAAPAAPRLHRGVELMMDEPLPDAAAANAALRLGGTRYILIEFGYHVPAQTVEHAIRQLQALGLRPIVAHPERYELCTPRAAAKWREWGGRLQLDATTLPAPGTRGGRARALLAAGLYDICAGDNHGDDRTLAVARNYLRAHGGEEQAELLVTRNPGAILQDGEMTAVAPLVVPGETEAGWLRKWRRK